MKATVIAAWCLFLGCQLGTCSVMVVAPSKSSQSVRINTWVEGKARKDVRVDVFRERKNGEEAGPLFSLTSDDEGKVGLPKLAPGNYHIVAAAEQDLVADLYLRVSSHSKQKISSFSMELVASQFPTFAQRLAAAEQLPVKARLQELSGIVRDSSGAAIAGVSIDVMRKATMGKECVARLKSDVNGRFLTALSDGAYVAFFSFAGFQTQFVPFDVAKAQGSGDLQVRLEIGAATQ